MKLKLLSVVSLVTLVGCGGSSTEDLGNISTVSEETRVGYSKDIVDWFDIEVGLYNQLQNSVNKSNIKVALDVNKNAIFDDGDVRIIAGNSSDFAQSMSAWAYGSDYLVEMNDAGKTVTFRALSGVIVGGADIKFVNNIGGVGTYTKIVDGSVSEQTLVLRTNRKISDSSPETTKLIHQLKLIDASTPINIELTDGLSDGSYDFVPEREIFTQQSMLSLQDPQSDYIGSSKWVDIKSVRFNSSSH